MSQVFPSPMSCDSLRLKHKQQARPSILLSYIDDFPDPPGSTNRLLLQMGQIWKVVCTVHSTKMYLDHGHQLYPKLTSFKLLNFNPYSNYAVFLQYPNLVKTLF